MKNRTKTVLQQHQMGDVKELATAAVACTKKSQPTARRFSSSIFCAADMQYDARMDLWCQFSQPWVIVTRVHRPLSVVGLSARARLVLCRRWPVLYPNSSRMILLLHPLFSTEVYTAPLAFPLVPRPAGQ